jgi:hypothetical protein
LYPFLISTFICIIDAKGKPGIEENTRCLLHSGTPGQEKRNPQAFGFDRISSDGNIYSSALVIGLYLKRECILREKQ